MRRRSCFSVLLLVAVAAACPTPASRSDVAAEAAPDRSFGEPRCAEIHGYTADAMEPYLTRDGRYLLFNSSNAPGVDTDLQVARVVDELTFAYDGPLRGANSAVLDGVPTLDDRGELFFVSVRSYDSTRSSVYRAQFSGGVARDARLVPGLPRERGVVIFDVDVSPDGNLLYYARGEFSGGPVPKTADLMIAERHGDTFVFSPARTAALAAINTPHALEYAAAISADGRELFFTRLTGRATRIYRAVRASTDVPFAPPAQLAAIEGFVEAPTLSPDGRRLYYHQRVNGRFVICRVRRTPAR